MSWMDRVFGSLRGSGNEFDRLLGENGEESNPGPVNSGEGQPPTTTESARWSSDDDDYYYYSSEEEDGVERSPGSRRKRTGTASRPSALSSSSSSPSPSSLEDRQNKDKEREEFEAGARLLAQETSNEEASAGDEQPSAFGLRWRRAKPSQEAAQQYAAMLASMDKEMHYLDAYYRSRAMGAASEFALEDGASWSNLSLFSGFREWLHWKTFKQRFPYYVPIMTWLPQYKWSYLPRDLAAGLAVAAMLIPQSLAMALLAGLPPQYGLYSCWFPLIVYACMGNSKQMAVGPETVASILLGLNLQSSGLDPSDYPNFTHIIAFTCGLFLFGLGILRFGFLDNVLSRPLLSGFINAVALMVMMEQVDTLLGITNAHLHDWHKFPNIIKNISHTNWQTLVLGIVTIMVLLSFRALNMLIAKTRQKRYSFVKFIPMTMVVVLISILFSWLSDLQAEGVAILGKIPSGFPVPQPPQLKSVGVFSDSLVSAMVISVLGFIESIIIAKHYAAKYNYPVSPNRELVALGMANILGSFFRIMPAFGSLMRSSIAESAGARTQLHGVVTALIMIMAILFLQPVFYYLPKTTLAAIIIVAALGLLELEDLFFLIKIRAWGALFLFVATLVLTLSLGVELGIVVSLGISVFLIIRHTSLPHIAILGLEPKSNKFKDISRWSDARTIPGIVVIRIEEALYFANIGQIKEMFSRIERMGSHTAHPSEKKTLPPLRGIVIDCRNIPEIDASAVQILFEMVEDYKLRRIRVCFVKLRGQLKMSFLRAGILGSTNVTDTVFASNKEAVDFIENGPRPNGYSSYLDSHRPEDDPDSYQRLSTILGKGGSSDQDSSRSSGYASSSNRHVAQPSGGDLVSFSV
ncbi:putative sulfate transporter [Balamuthia mandrillaris]